MGIRYFWKFMLNENVGIGTSETPTKGAPILTRQEVRNAASIIETAVDHVITTEGLTPEDVGYSTHREMTDALVIAHIEQTLALPADERYLSVKNRIESLFKVTKDAIGRLSELLQVSTLEVRVQKDAPVQSTIKTSGPVAAILSFSRNILEGRVANPDRVIESVSKRLKGNSAA